MGSSWGRKESDIERQTLAEEGLPWRLSSKESSCNAGDLQETQVRSLGQEDTLEKGIATHSSILGWKIPWTKEPGGLQSMGSQSQTRLRD